MRLAPAVASATVTVTRCSLYVMRINAGSSGRRRAGSKGVRSVVSATLCQGLSRRGRVEDTPDAMPSRDIGAFAAGHLSDEGKSVLSRRTKAGLPSDNPFGMERG